MTTETVKRWQDRIDLASATMSDRRKAMFQEIAELRAQVAQHKVNAEHLLTLLKRYRNEVPLGHQPHMIAHIVDAAIDKARKS